MKVVFPVMGAENISVAYLSTIVKNQGHESKVAFDRALFDDKQYFSIGFLHKLFDHEEKMITAIIKERPDVLALSVFADNYQWALYVAKKAGQSRLHVRPGFVGTTIIVVVVGLSGIIELSTYYHILGTDFLFYHALR